MNVSMKEGLPPVENSTLPDMDPEEFEQLVAEVLENPAKLNDEALTDEQILELSRRLNPYSQTAGPAPTKEHIRGLTCSYTNLAEDFQRRKTMTSFVSFIGQMLHEWEVPAESRRWVPARREERPAPLDPRRMIERLESALALAHEAAASADAATAAAAAAATEEVMLPDEVHADVIKRMEDRIMQSNELTAKAAGLVFAATHAIHSAGVEATDRLRAAHDAAMKHPACREVLAGRPVPPPPGQIEMPPAVAKDIIRGFLSNYLCYDPSVHVRIAKSKDFDKSVAEVAVGLDKRLVDKDDIGRLTVEAVRAAPVRPKAEHLEAFLALTETKATRSAGIAVLDSPGILEHLVTAVENPVDFAHYLKPLGTTAADGTSRPATNEAALDWIPPQDTFHRWNYYDEVNYDRLVTITKALYEERSEFDFAFAPWEMHEGAPDAVMAAHEKHVDRYAEEAISDMKLLTFGAWNIITNTAKNRGNINFYNRNTAVLKRILDRHAEDKKIGGALMKDRLKKAKAKNIAEDGPDAPGLGQYRTMVSERGQGLSAQGAERVISQEQMRRLEKAQGNRKAADELEYLDGLLKEAAELEAIAKTRPLNESEQRQQVLLTGQIRNAREQIEVPDDHIQVDMFINDGGVMEKRTMYTRAEAPTGPESGPLRSSGSQHPAATKSLLQQKAAANPPADNVDPMALPKYAPFVVDAILAERAASQSAADAERDQAAVVATAKTLGSA